MRPLLRNPEEQFRGSWRLFVQRELLGECQNACGNLVLLLIVVIDAVCNAVRDDLHLFHAHTAGRSGRGAQTNAGGDERAALLARNGVLVGGDVNRIQTRFQILADALLVGQINEEQDDCRCRRETGLTPRAAAADHSIASQRSCVRTP